MKILQQNSAIKTKKHEIYIGENNSHCTSVYKSIKKITITFFFYILKRDFIVFMIFIFKDLLPEEKVNFLEREKVKK